MSKEALTADPVRELSVDERFTWGECPICKAPHGKRCDNTIGIVLGETVTGQRPHDGAHVARLQRAPVRVREVSCD